MYASRQITEPSRPLAALLGRHDVTPVVRILTHRIDALEKEVTALRAERDRAFAESIELLVTGLHTEGSGPPGSFDRSVPPSLRLAPAYDEEDAPADIAPSPVLDLDERDEAYHVFRSHVSPASAANDPGGFDIDDRKASFIAAARWAAEAASETWPSDDVEARRSRVAGYGALGRRSNLARRIKQTLYGRRRAVPLGIAAFVLTLGGLHASGNLSAQSPLPAASAERSQKGGSIVSRLPQQHGPVMEVDDARATAVTPSEAVGQHRSGSQPPHPADPAKTDARLDQPRLGSNEGSDAVLPAQMFAGIPRIPAVGDIPAGAGPASLRLAAMAGDPAAVYELASRAADGRGMTRDPSLSARLFETAAAHGLVPAQYRIGKHYEKGLGVPRNLAAAKGWYEQAAEKGNVHAMHQLAVLIAEGAVGKPDHVAAIAWFRRAAQLGLRDSQFNLAVLLARGLGTQQDLGGSYTWLSIVTAQGDEEAAKKRDEVGARLSPAALSAAKLAAERWHPETPDTIANEVVQPAHGWGKPG